jgi:hypothetical protein
MKDQLGSGWIMEVTRKAEASSTTWIEDRGQVPAYFADTFFSFCRL